MADAAAVGRRDARGEMTPRAVPYSPCPGMAARGGLVVTADTVVLPVAGTAALAVHAGGQSVTAGAPEIIMVLRHARRMARDAIRLFMTGQACVPGLSGLVDVHGGAHAMVLYPVPFVRVRPGERHFIGSSGDDGSQDDPGNDAE